MPREKRNGDRYRYPCGRRRTPPTDTSPERMAQLEKSLAVIRAAWGKKT